MMASWRECIRLARTITDRYSLTEEQQKLVYKLAMTVPCGSAVMELGVCHGKTSVVLAYAARARGFEFHGIDDFSLEGSGTEFRTSLDRLGLPYSLYEGKTQRVPWDRPLAMLLVDAGHDPVNVKADIERWSTFVRPGGYILFHDYPEPFVRRSAHWAVRFYADQVTGDWQEVAFARSGPEGADGLKVRRRPEK